MNQVTLCPLTQYASVISPVFLLLQILLKLYKECMSLKIYVDISLITLLSHLSVKTISLFKAFFKKALSPDFYAFSSSSLFRCQMSSMDVL